MVETTKNKGGAPEGNQNASKNRLWADAIKRALARAGKNVDGGLNKLADKLIEAGLTGDQWALREVGDRIDGKPPQALNIGGQEDNPLIIEPARPKIDQEKWLALHVVK